MSDSHSGSDALARVQAAIQSIRRTLPPDEVEFAFVHEEGPSNPHAPSAKIGLLVRESLEDMNAQNIQHGWLTIRLDASLVEVEQVQEFFDRFATSMEAVIPRQLQGDPFRVNIAHRLDSSHDVLLSTQLFTLTDKGYADQLVGKLSQAYDEVFYGLS